MEAKLITDGWKLSSHTCGGDSMFFKDNKVIILDKKDGSIREYITESPHP